MKVSTNAEKLQSLVSDVAKGVGDNKLLPITSMIGIKYADGTLYFTSTDGANLLRVSADIGKAEKDEDYGDITVSADMFIGLVSKLSDCSSIDLEVDNSILVVSAYQGVKAVGEYKLELPLDDMGGIVKFPNLDTKIDLVNSADDPVSYSLNEVTVNEMLNSCKQALATDVSESCYANYLVGEKIMSTDRARAVFLDTNILNGQEHFLLGRRFTDLLALMNEDIKLTVSTAGMYATDEHGTELYTSATGDIGEFNEKAMDNMLKMEFTSMCKIRKSELLNTLNRMMLFCSKYDNNGIDVKFREDSLIISSLKSSAVEEIEYTEFKNAEMFDMCIDVTLLLSHIKAYASDIVELHFGNPKCIKLVDGSVTQIIALVAKS